MALGASYATSTELKTRLDITVTTWDTQLGEALSAVSRAIEKFCDRQFNDAGGVSVRVFYADTAYVCRVEDFHTTVGLIVKTDQGDDGTYETTWSSSDYQLEPLNGLVDGESGWPYNKIRAVEGYTFPRCSKRAPVQITAHWGWTAVPATVKEACLMLAEEQFKLKEAPFGVAGYGAYGPIRVRTNPKVAEMLGPYRLSPVLVA